MAPLSLPFSEARCLFMLIHKVALVRRSTKIYFGKFFCPSLDLQVIDFKANFFCFSDRHFVGSRINTGFGACQ
jgi:hypothetical protein